MQLARLSCVVRLVEVIESRSVTGMAKAHLGGRNGSFVTAVVVGVLPPGGARLAGDEFPFQIVVPLTRRPFDPAKVKRVLRTPSPSGHRLEVAPISIAETRIFLPGRLPDIQRATHWFADHVDAVLPGLIRM